MEAKDKAIVIPLGNVYIIMTGMLDATHPFIRMEIRCNACDQTITTRTVTVDGTVAPGVAMRHAMADNAKVMAHACRAN